MGFRCFLCLVIGLSWRLTCGESTGAYKPPLLLSPPVPVASSSALQNSYQPPIALEYRSPLGRQDNAPPQSYSVVYTPPETPRHSAYGGVSLQHQSNALPTSFHQSAGPDPAKSLPTAYQQQPVATSYSVQQQPASVERSYVQGSAPIQKAPASEIQPEKSPLASDRDNKKEEYVVYYYYYYDNDTAAGHSGNNNLSLSFDDIPSLEGYDNDAAKPDPEKSANSLSPEAPPLSSQGRSVSGSADRPIQDETFLQPLRPVPNVFRYGSNEVPRFPVLPNFVVSQTAPPTETPPPATSEANPTTQPTFNGVDLDNELNNHVLEPRPNQHEEPQTSPHTSTTTSVPETTTATTTETPTTEPTTTTERPRRRPPVGGGRRRFSPSTSPAPRTRPTAASTAASSSTTRTTPSGRFQGNRVRSRPSGGFGRTRTAPRGTDEEDGSSPDTPTSQAAAGSPSSTTPAPRNRFTSQAPRGRFQSSRSRSQTASSSTSSTTSTTRAPSRARTTSRPRPNIVSNRNRPPRPGFLRPRNPEPETTTAEPEPTEEPSPAPEEEEEEERGAGPDEEGEEPEEEGEETEAPPTTTEANRFSALFKPRNRANRPRPPLIGNRPPRV